LLFMEIFAIYCENHTKKKTHTHTQYVFSMRKVLNVKAGGAQTHHCAVLGQTI